MSDNNDASLLSFLSGLGLGAVIGLIVAILLAPSAGEETRTHALHLLPNREA